MTECLDHVQIDFPLRLGSYCAKGTRTVLGNNVSYECPVSAQSNVYSSVGLCQKLVLVSLCINIMNFACLSLFSLFYLHLHFPDRRSGEDHSKVPEGLVNSGLSFDNPGQLSEIVVESLQPFDYLIKKVQLTQ